MRWWQRDSQWLTYEDADESQDEQEIFFLRVMKSCLIVWIRKVKCSGSVWSLYKECIVARGKRRSREVRGAITLAQESNDGGWHRTEIVEMMIYWGVNPLEDEGRTDWGCWGTGRVMLIRWGCFIWNSYFPVFPLWWRVTVLFRFTFILSIVRYPNEMPNWQFGIQLERYKNNWRARDVDFMDYDMLWSHS